MELAHYLAAPGAQGTKARQELYQIYIPNVFGCDILTWGMATVLEGQETRVKANADNATSKTYRSPL